MRTKVKRAGDFEEKVVEIKPVLSRCRVCDCTDVVKFSEVGCLGTTTVRPIEKASITVEARLILCRMCGTLQKGDSPDWMEQKLNLGEMSGDVLAPPDLLSRLENPREVLREIAESLGHNNQLVLREKTLKNIVQTLDAGIFNPEYRCYFSLHTLFAILGDAGLVIVDIQREESLPSDEGYVIYARPTLWVQQSLYGKTSGHFSEAPQRMARLMLEDEGMDNPNVFGAVFKVFETLRTRIGNWLKKQQKGEDKAQVAVYGLSARDAFLTQVFHLHEMPLVCTWAVCGVEDRGKGLSGRYVAGALPVVESVPSGVKYLIVFSEERLLEVLHQTEQKWIVAGGAVLAIYGATPALYRFDGVRVVVDLRSFG